MRHLLHRALILVCALYLSGSHWMVLQVTAWAGMVVARAQTATVMEAVGSTFDGQHPCALCHAIDAGKGSEQPAEKDTPVTKKLEDSKFIAVHAAGRILLPCTEARWPDALTSSSSRWEAPPSPPPQA